MHTHTHTYVQTQKNIYRNSCSCLLTYIVREKHKEFSVAGTWGVVRAEVGDMGWAG